MPTERLVKWSKESQGFFEKAGDKSVELTFMVSQANESQTGEGFEEFVNSINELSQKINKLIIIDTTFLYRHCIPEFSQHLNENIATIWFLNNQNTLNKIQCDVLIESYVKQINSNLFKQCYNKIVKDFEIVEDFKKLITHEAKMFFSKGKGSFDGCLEFLIEEYAHACAFLKNRNIVYPMPFSPVMLNIIERYKLNITGMHYSISNYMRKYSNKNLRNLVNEEILQLLKIEDLKINCFAINKNGRYIYKNNIYHNIIGNVPYVTDPKAWKISLDIMEKKEQRIIEEKAPDGNHYLSVKSPLEINGKVEGVIGLAVDITDRKKKEELENKLKMEKELYKLAREVAHDICSPLSALEMVKYMSLDKLGEQERKMFELSIRRIKDITNKLIERYKGRKEKKEEYIMPSSIKEVIESMRYRYQDREIKFKYNEEDREKFAFIKGEWSEFSRMMTNVIKNGVEAIEGKEGEIEVSEKVKGEEVEIRVKDNGKGMSKEKAEKIKKGEGVGTTKKGGHGIGTQQIIKTVKAMKGNIEIETKEGEGTEIIVTFPKAEKPRWFADKIEIKKGEEVVIVDDEELMHEVWKEKLKGYEKEIRLKFFKQGVEALKYINSLERKEKVFLIADYELRKQEINGIEVIEKSGMKERHIMVTNAYLADIKDFEEKSEYIKLFPKMYIDDIKLEVV